MYDGLSEDEKCQKTTYIVQFLWRDLSSDFDVVGPYFNCSSSMEAQFLHSMVTRMMLAFSQFGFQVRALLCDGASSNLSLLKVLCGYSNCENIDIAKPSFKSPFDGKDVHLIVCPSHQVSNVCVLHATRHPHYALEFARVNSVRADMLLRSLLITTPWSRCYRLT